MNDNTQTAPDRARRLSADDLEAILTAPERLMATALHAERRAQQLIDADLPAAAGDWLRVALRARRLADAWTPAAP